VILLNEARYFWSHGIPFRSFDYDDNNNLIQRTRRVSFTYRKARGAPCSCEFLEACDIRTPT